MTTCFFRIALVSAPHPDDEFEKLLAQKRRVAVYSIEEDWIDVGRREELRRAREGA